jgi:hypothetical protein
VRWSGARGERVGRDVADLCDEITSILPELGRRGGSFGRESIVQLGLDSLDVRVLVQNVNAKLGVDLPLSIVFEYATPAELAKHIFDECATTGPVAAARGSGGGAGGSRLQCRTTTDDYHLWAHGFAVTATLFHSVRLLEALVARPGLTLAQLCGATRANAGHAAVLLRYCCAR